MRLFVALAIVGLAHAQVNVLDSCTVNDYGECSSQSTQATCNAKPCCAYSIVNNAGQCMALPHNMGTSKERSIRVDKVNIAHNNNASSACFATDLQTDYTLCMLVVGDWRTSTPTQKAHHAICANTNEQGVEFDIEFTAAAQKCVNSALCKGFSYSSSAVNNIPNSTSNASTGAAQYYTWTDKITNTDQNAVKLGGNNTQPDTSFECFALHVLSEKSPSKDDLLFDKVHTNNILAVTGVVLAIIAFIFILLIMFNMIKVSRGGGIAGSMNRMLL